MKQVFKYLRSRPLSFASLIVIIFLYLVMIFAEFIAPYSPNTAFEAGSFHPSDVEITSHGLCAREHRVLDSVTWKYARVKGLTHKIHFFAKGEKYKLFGFVPCERHLFATLPDESGEVYPVFLFGADNLGRDLFSRIVYGSRISLTIGFVASAISLFLAILFGGLAGFYGGAADWLIMRFSEFFMLIPGLYLILFLRSLLNSSMDSGESYMVITVILSLVGWPGSARTLRGMIHAIKREEFVADAEIEGVPSGVIIFRHIIPQITSLLIVSTTLSIPGFIMSETTLSYLGLGIADPAVSWGSLINRDISTLSNLRNFPWLLIPVFLLLVVTLAFNFLGDALRDFYDPYHAVFKKSALARLKAKFEEKSAEPVIARSAAGSDEAISIRGVDCFADALNDGEADALGIDGHPVQTRIKDSRGNFFLGSCRPWQLGSDSEAKRSETERSNEAGRRTPEKPDGTKCRNALTTNNFSLATNMILSVQNLKVSFFLLRGKEQVEIHSVRGVSFEMKRGEILGIVGESGSGKTVTATSIPRLLPENALVSGNILFNDSKNAVIEPVEITSKDKPGNETSGNFVDFASLSQKDLRSYRGKKIGMIFQEPGRSFDPLQNMESVFFETFRNSEPKITREEARKKAAELLREVGLTDAESRLKNFPHQFSGGQLQRISIALSLAQGCELLIADEPTTALDVTIQSQIVSLLRRLNKERGLSIIFISHNINLVAGLCDNIIVMYGGIIMEKGTAEQIMSAPKNPYSQALISSTPKFGSHYTSEKMASIPGRVTDPAHPESGCPFAPRCQFAKDECRSPLRIQGGLDCWKERS